MTYQFEEDQNQTLNIYALNTESRIVSKYSKALKYVHIANKLLQEVKVLSDMNGVSRYKHFNFQRVFPFFFIQNALAFFT